MPTCTSCNRDVGQDGRATNFPCPNCGEAEIWRCEKCRRLSNQYVCPNCGFTGP
ncbi:RNA-binding protein [candidate division MSBL1 archaeon SCGC-AAA261C02]|uniref:RNA-binding protein n=1 Tax=candidate division MSBL1 archaeon SCGC-AAA261C02 TaxID=1698272 RepID=A0A133V1W5_9EURY|nr:RNA-binding protein [candidate division MSBL1 archaeon SCGC-AAA261C02]